MPTSRLLFCTVALALAAGAGSAQILVDDRVVETKADGPCFDALTLEAQVYVDCGNGTVYDTLNNLLWLQDASCDALGTLGYGDWLTAQDAAAGVFHGLDCDDDKLPDLTDRSQPGDWRLPTREEWQTLMVWASWLECDAGSAGGAPAILSDSGEGCSSTLPSSFTGVEPLEYWSSEIDETDPSLAHTADLLFAELSTFGRAVPFGAAIWPVRQGGSPDHEGAVVVGDAVVDTRADPPCVSDLGTLPERYRTCGDGTVYDAVTGLLWLQDASCAELQNYGPLGADWVHANEQAARLEDGRCGLSDGSQPGDWRLPTQREWLQTTEVADLMSCTSPALTDVSGTLCASEAPTPFSGLEDTVLSEDVFHVFWTSNAVPGEDLAVAFGLFCGLSQCPDIQLWQLPICIRCGTVGGAPRDSSQVFVWPVREIH